MALRKYKHSGDVSSVNMTTLNLSRNILQGDNSAVPDMTSGLPAEAGVDIDLREVYFLIMHFLSSGPCQRTYVQFWNELLEHQLLPRRYHAWYSRSGAPSGDVNDNGNSFPLSYSNLVERYPHIEKNHLVKLLKRLILSCSSPSNSMVGGSTPNAADVPTLLGSGSFSLLESNRDREDQKANCMPGYLRWPHMQADQVHGLSLREIGGGFTKHHRAPSIRAACYAIAKPSTMLQKMQIIKRLRGHQNAVYCAIFDRSGRYVITGSDDRLVKIWSMETAFCLSSCRGHEGDITDLAVSSNNAVVASASNDFIIRVWRLPDGMPISVLRGHTGAVTAIAFSPRPSAVYQLLSSSDDGTCRIWDAKNPLSSPRVYTPKPADVVAGKNNDSSSNAGQQAHQILCCAYNANGTVFVTGSSDTRARVWNAFKTNLEDSEQPNHEMDLLSGHENDVNYVQFSGCAVASRSSAADTSKEDNIPKFKNSWFTHDNIVTCSRDGSAIIWIPRSRRSHGKVGRWTRAYHLKVPPPPMPPQPHRGGPRQRFQPTPRGVNMIMWSLDNRFVLAAIMDCRICVWNASDGSLVHSLMGHSESTFVLDVHPFNPRIAMSAGYDGKTIIWDIREGTPVHIYETGHFKLVDGKFSSDGTSIVLSDEVGQIFILATGQGESQKDAKYDQFFLGDYRPLIQDTQGYVLDQETQLTPYRRNLQDLLCDSSMIPYPESYQNMYQQRRLGALGFEWCPPSVKFVVGPSDNINAGDYQMLPIDLDRWVEPIPEFLDAIDFEQENEVQSDDNDSEYNANEENSSEGGQGSLSISSSRDSECSAGDSELDNSNKEGLRRSKRKKHKSEVEFMTSSGRRVKRRNWDECDGTTFGNHRARRSRNGKLISKRKSSKSKSLRPQRRAARNALNLFSQITGVSTDGEDEDDSETESAESESLFQDSNNQSNESDRSMKKTQVKHTKQKEAVLDDFEDHPKSSELTNGGSRRRLVLKFPVRDSKKMVSPENTRSESHEQYAMVLSDKATSGGSNLGDAVDAISQNGSAGKIRERGQIEKFRDQSDSCSGYKDSQIKWGEVKARSLKRLRQSDSSLMDAQPIQNAHLDGLNTITNDVIEQTKSEYECGMSSNSANQQHEDISCRKYEDQLLPNADAHERGAPPVTGNGNRTETEQHSECKVPEEPVEGVGMVIDDRDVSGLFSKSGAERCQEAENNTELISWKVRIKSKGLSDEPSNSLSKLKSITADDWRSECDIMSKGLMQAEQNLVSVLPEEDEGTGGQSPFHSDGSRKLDPYKNKDSMLSISQDSKDSQLDTSSKMINAVYKRSKSFRGRKNVEVDIHHIEGSTLNYNHHNIDQNAASSVLTVNGVCRTRTNGVKAIADEMNSMVNSFGRETFLVGEISKVGGKSASNGCEQLLCDDWKSASKLTVGLRSARNRRENYNTCDLRSLDKRKTQHQVKKLSWLLLSEHEEYYRYIPQQGDEVAYLRQGHEEYIKASRPQEIGPWRLVKGSLKIVEFCKVEVLDYSTLPGSGESCCKLTLEFIDPSSCAFGKAFKLTLPELVAYPDFLVERTRYDAAIERNWTHRDKCQVWWRNEDGEGGSWWEGRILAVKPKCIDFPESPWERYVIQYRNDSSGQHLHSPWELHDADSQWEHPCIDERSRNMLLSSFWEVEQSSTRDQDSHGIQKLNQVAHKSDFLNRFPVPLSFEVIKRRLENNYYRSLDAFKHDTMVMLSNAQTYFSKRADSAVKMRRLSDFIKRTLSSL